jgi:ATP-binding cassette subfamily C protein
MCSLGLLPLYVALVVDSGSLSSLLPGINEYLSKFTYIEVVVLSSIILLFVFFLKNLILAFQFYYENNLVVNLNEKFSAKIFQSYLDSDYLFYIKKNIGFFTRNLTTEINNTVSLIYAIIILFREGLVMLVISFILFIRSPYITIILFLILFLSVFIFFKIARTKIKTLSEFLLETRSLQLQTIHQTFGLFKTVKIFDIEKNLSKKFSNISRQKEKSEFYLRFIKQLPKLVLEVMAIISLLLLTLFVIYYYQKDHYIVILSTIAVAVIRLVPSFNSVTSALSNIKSLIVSFESIFPNLNNSKKDSLILDKNHSAIKQKKILNNFKKIKLKNVNFSYDNKQDFSLKDLNLEIYNGDSIAIIGKSGSGKTTLVDIIIGLLKIDNGEYFVDNNKIINPIDFWKTKVGYVAQEVFLIDDTIEANISFSQKDNISDSEKKIKILYALKQSMMLDYVNNLPEKEKTKVGDRGIMLSGGQRQRLAIARALYANPDLLIMDEATNALDAKTENEILDTLNLLKKNKTLLVIAHRPRTIKAMDKIMLIENGLVKFFGKKEDFNENYEF